MMTINLLVKANVDNLRLSEIFELLSQYAKDKQSPLKFKDFLFQIDVKIDLGIHYTITEIA
jgi:hypothetical protein